VGSLDDTTRPSRLINAARAPTRSSAGRQRASIWSTRMSAAATPMARPPTMTGAEIVTRWMFVPPSSKNGPAVHGSSRAVGSRNHSAEG